MNVRPFMQIQADYPKYDRTSDYMLFCGVEILES